MGIEHLLQFCEEREHGQDVQKTCHTHHCCCGDGHGLFALLFEVFG